MAYISIVEMAGSQSLLARITAAAAAEAIPEPSQWAQANIWQLAATPGWADAWDYARDTATDEQNPDTGKRPGVISDQMILSAVQARWAETNPAPPA
jgi:hypothetical protein